MNHRTEQSKQVPQKIDEVLERLNPRIRRELARLGSLPQGPREAVLQMLPFGTRTVMEILGLVEAEPETAYGVRILSLRPLGNAVIERLVHEEAGTGATSIPVEEILERDDDETEVAHWESEVDLVPVHVNLEQPVRSPETAIAWVQLIEEGPLSATVEVGMGMEAATVAHLTIEAVPSAVRVWQTSGIVDVIDATTRQPLPTEGSPLEIKAVEGSGNPLDIVASRLAVDISNSTAS